MNGPNPLAQRDILDRAELVGFCSVAEKLWYLEVMRALDAEYMSFVSKKQKQAQEAAKAEAKARRP